MPSPALIGSNFVIIPRCSIVAITMKLGRFSCRDRQQAISAVKMAMDLGIPIDFHKALNGEYQTYVSNEGVEKLRLKHNWKSPRERKIKSSGKRQRRQPKKDYGLVFISSTI